MQEWGSMGREAKVTVGTSAPVLLTDFATDDEQDRIGVGISLCDSTDANLLYIKFVTAGSDAPDIDTGSTDGYHDVIPAKQAIDYRCNRGVDVWAITDVGNCLVVTVEKRA